MDFRFSAEAEAFRQEVRRFVKEEPPQSFPLQNPDDAFGIGGWSYEFSRRLGEKGWLSIGWPREWGGQGSRMKFAIFEDEINYYGSPGLDAGVTYRNVSPTLVHHCTEEQKRKYLPPTAKGEVIWCQGFSEPNAGSDLAALTTRAVDKGGYFVVDGQKTWTTLGHVADYGIFLFRTDPDAPRHRGITMFIVDMNTPGITRNPVKNLLRRNVWSEIFLDGVKIPRENMIGEKNQGWQLITSTLNTERSGMHWLGASRRGLDRIVNYVKEREPLAKNPLIRHKVADLV